MPNNILMSQLSSFKLQAPTVLASELLADSSGATRQRNMPANKQSTSSVRKSIEMSLAAPHYCRGAYVVDERAAPTDSQPEFTNYLITDVE